MADLTPQELRKINSEYWKQLEATQDFRDAMKQCMDKASMWAAKGYTSTKCTPDHHHLYTKLAEAMNRRGFEAKTGVSKEFPSAGTSYIHFSWVNVIP